MGRIPVPFRFLIVAFVALGVLSLQGPALACEVCFGAAGDPATKGMNNAILFLLGVIGFVQVGFVGLFLGFRRRSRNRAEIKEKLRVLQGGLH